MKRVLAMIAVFVLACVVAGYIAMAPFADAREGGLLSMLDAAAQQFVVLAGRTGAILGTLGVGMVLALLTAQAVGGTAPPSVRPIPVLRKRVAAEPEPSGADRQPIFRPDPGLSEERIAALRRRAAGDVPAPREEYVPFAQAPDDEGKAQAGEPQGDAANLPVPVVLVRKPRDRDRDWTTDTSWLGGLPRLGDTPWPRGSDGLPLPFAAQIDLADLAAACPGSPLPQSGSLAFFLGTGAVIAMPEGAHDFTDPPEDLPPGYDEGGLAFPARLSRRSRYLFPFWPVEAVPLNLPPALRDTADPARHAAIGAEMAKVLAQTIPDRETAPLRAAPQGAPVEDVWWLGVYHLADSLHDALDRADALIAERREAHVAAQEALAAMNARGDASYDSVERAAVELADAKAELGAMEQERAELPQMIAAMEGFVDGRDPWERLTGEELALVEEILAEVHGRYGDLVAGIVPPDIDALAVICLKVMIAGPPEALAALPEAQLARLNGDHPLPSSFQHQVFGLGAGDAGRIHRDQILLLQLAADEMMEWGWDADALFQFWIDPADAEAGNWWAAKLTFDQA